MWEHRRTKQRYQAVDDQTTSLSGKVRVQSATTGRWYWIPQGMLVNLGPSLSEAEDQRLSEERAARQERMNHLAWQLSRELPYNLGVAVTNIAMAEWDGDLLTARAAIRDEEERLRNTASTTTDEGTS